MPSATTSPTNTITVPAQRIGNRGGTTPDGARIPITWIIEDIHVPMPDLTGLPVDLVDKYTAPFGELWKATASLWLAAQPSILNSEFTVEGTELPSPSPMLSTLFPQWLWFTADAQYLGNELGNDPDPRYHYRVAPRDLPLGWHIGLYVHRFATYTQAQRQQSREASQRAAATADRIIADVDRFTPTMRERQLAAWLLHLVDTGARP